MSDSITLNDVSYPDRQNARGPAATDGLQFEAQGGQDVYVVVLAGGEGRRLRCFVRQFLGTERPKQFCRITGTRSMLRHTWDRAARLVEPGHIVTVITAGQEPYLEDEVGGGGVPGTVLVQPENKETAAGLLLPLLWIARRAPAATVAVFPADHFIWEEERFAAHVRAAVSIAQERPDRLALLGVEADGPEVGYGWIAPGEPLAAMADTELYAVRRFWEKPDPNTAAHLFARRYLWNTLVLAGRVAAYTHLAAACIPRVLNPLRDAAERFGSAAEAEALGQAYSRITPRNFSEAVLARNPHPLMVLAARDVTWSDWGEPHHIVNTLRRFDRRTQWLPAYVSEQRQSATSPAPS